MAEALSSAGLLALQREKEDFWRKYTGLPEEQIHAMWVNAVYSATTSNNFSTVQSNHWRRDIPRSLSTGGRSQSSFYTGLPAHAPMLPLQRECSRQSAPAAMPSLTRSSTQSSSYGLSLPQDSLLAYGCDGDDPTGTLPTDSSKPHQTGSGHGNYSIAGQDCKFEAVGEFLDRTDPGYPHTPMPAPEHPGKRIYDRRSICSDSASNLHCYVPGYPSTPTSVELTNGTTIASGMSRQASTIGSSICGALEMSRLESADSNLSMSGEPSQLEFSQSFDKSITTSAPFSYNPLSFVGAAVDIPQFPSQSFDQPSLQLPTNFSEEMEREDSNQSANSASSRSTRSRTHLARPIAPKKSNDSTNMSRQPSATHAALLTDLSKLEGQSDSWVEEKPPKSYCRPQRPRVACEYCDDYPEGFRGDHERRRHHERVHARTRKVWVAVESTDTSGPRPEIALSACKSCRTGKKYYAYYNVAAHLRRAHFNPKMKRKGKGRVASASEEKRSGKGGGDYPPMEVLRKWMMDAEEDVPTNAEESSSDVECERDASFSTAPSTNSALICYNNTTDTAISTPIAGSQVAVGNGYCEPERHALYSSMNYDDSLFESDPTTTLPDLYQVNSNDPTSLNESNSFNDDFSFFMNDATPFRNREF